MILIFRNRLVRSCITSVFKLCGEKAKSSTCLEMFIVVVRDMLGHAVDVVKDIELETLKSGWGRHVNSRPFHFNV